MEELIKKSNEAIRHYDDVESIKLLKEWGNLLISQNIERTNPQLFRKIQEILIGLKIAAFPLLPEREACDVLRFHFLESFDIEVFMDNRIAASLFSIPEFPRDALREKYKIALMENNQKLGHLSVSQWIKLFEKEYPVEERPLTVSFDFITSNMEVKKLSPAVKERLKETLHVYDYYLVTTIPNTGAELNKIISYLMSEDNPAETSSTEYSPPKYIGSVISSSKTKKIIQINLKEALKNYSRLGEQIVTYSAIRLKSFNQPVRPSIKNWLYDYTSILGQGTHDSMQRTNYLFRSENAKNLSSPEREKLGIILKSFDENTPLPIDTENNEIVFEVHAEQPVQSKVRPFPSGEQVAGIPQGQTLGENFIRPYPAPAKPAIAKPALSKPVENSFVRPYQSPEARPSVPSQPIQKTDQSSTFLSRQQSSRDSSKSNFIQFVNPYPAPETHEMAGEAPVKFKGFSEGVSKSAKPPAARPSPPPFAKGGVPQSQALNEPPKPYTPSHPKNVIYPHYGPQREDKPEPKIDGNVVDLSGNDK